MPKKCPACGTGIVREGAYHFCPAGLSCHPQLTGRIVHYASREAMDIEGLSEKTAKQLVDSGLVKDIADLYRLSTDDILELDGFARKSAAQLHDAIRSSVRPKFGCFLYALGIRHVGEHSARVLADTYSTLIDLEHADHEQLRQIPEIGPEVARSVTDFFEQDDNRSVLKRLFDSGIKIQTDSEQKKELPLEDQTFVFTGSLHKYTRSEAKKKVESLGARASSSVSSKTDAVVVGDEPGGKLDEAKKLGVKTIDQPEFEKLISKTPGARKKK